MRETLKICRPGSELKNERDYCSHLCTGYDVALSKGETKIGMGTSCSVKTPKIQSRTVPLALESLVTKR